MKTRQDEPVRITLTPKVHHMIISMKTDGMENKVLCSLGSQVQIEASMMGRSLALFTVLDDYMTKCMRIGFRMKDLSLEHQIVLISSHQILRRMLDLVALLFVLRGIAHLMMDDSRHRFTYCFSSILILS